MGIWTNEIRSAAKTAAFNTLSVREFYDEEEHGTDWLHYLKEHLGTDDAANKILYYAELMSDGGVPPLWRIREMLEAA